MQNDYVRFTEPMIELYTSRAIVRRVDSNAPLDAVVRRALVGLADTDYVLVAGSVCSGKRTIAAAIAKTFGFDILDFDAAIREAEAAAAAEHRIPAGSSEDRTEHAVINGGASRSSIFSASLAVSFARKAMAGRSAAAVRRSEPQSAKTAGLALVRQLLQKLCGNRRVLLIGYPKALWQLFRLMDDIGTAQALMLIDTAPEVCVERALRQGRARDDIKGRMASFKVLESAVIEHFATTGKLWRVAGSAPVRLVEHDAARWFRPARVICVLGGPGHRTKQHAKALATEFGFRPICLAELFKAEIRSQSGVAQMIAALIRQSLPIPDDVTLDVLAAEAQAHRGQTLVIEGFPRTLEQAQMLQKRLGDPEVVFLLEGTAECMHRRLAEAAEAERCGTLRLQLAVRSANAFGQLIRPVASYYSTLGRLVAIDADGSSSAAYRVLRNRFKVVELIFVLGGPCSGKRTLSQLVSDRIGLVSLAVSNLLRSEVASLSALGRAIDHHVRTQTRIPPAILVTLIEAAISATTESVLLLADFPRDIADVNELRSRAKISERALFLDCSPATLHARLQAQSAAPAEIQTRLSAFRRDMMPVVKHLMELGCLAVIRADNAPEVVFSALLPRFKPCGPIAVLGARRVGKKTLALGLHNRLGWKVIDMAQCIRQEVRLGLYLGTMISSALSANVQIPPAAILAVLRKALFLCETERCILLDFPRHVDHAVHVQSHLELTAALFLDAPSDIVFARQDFPSAPQMDRNEFALAAEYMRTLTFLQKCAKVHRIDAAGSEEDVLLQSLAVVHGTQAHADTASSIDEGDAAAEPALTCWPLSEAKIEIVCVTGPAGVGCSLHAGRISLGLAYHLIAVDEPTKLTTTGHGRRGSAASVGAKDAEKAAKECMVRVQLGAAAGSTRFVLDGFPCTRDELCELESEILAMKTARLRGIIWLRASVEAVRSRAGGRRGQFSEAAFVAAEAQRKLLANHCSAVQHRFMEVDAESSEDRTWRHLLTLLSPPVTIVVVGGSDAAQHRLLAAMPWNSDGLTLNVRELVKAATFGSNAESAATIRRRVEAGQAISSELVVELIKDAVLSGLRPKASRLLLQVGPRMTHVAFRTVRSRGDSPYRSVGAGVPSKFC